MLKRSVICLLVSLTLIVGSAPTIRARDDTKGQKIGKIVVDAVSTALPVVGDVLKVLGLGSAKPDDKVKKSQIEDQLKAARTQWLADAQAKVQPIAVVSKELGTLYQFMEPATDANELIIQMRTILSANPTPSEAVWTQLKNKWDLAKPLIQKLDKVDDKDINNVRDKWLRDTLSTLKGLNNTAVGQLGQDITDKNVVALGDDLKDMSTILVQISRASRYEISDLQSDTDGLAKWSQGNAGSPNELTPDNNSNAKLKEIRDEVDPDVEALLQRHPLTK